VASFSALADTKALNSPAKPSEGYHLTQEGCPMTRFWENPFIFGGPKNDLLIGNDRNNFIFGRDGQDDIRPGAGHDVVFAGRGRDTIDGSLGDDYIDGGQGFDTVTYDGGINDYEISRVGWGWAKSVVVTSLDPGATDAGRDVLKRVEALYFAGDD
jgi:Ca2+-binding RTX toxin-like protein